MEGVPDSNYCTLDNPDDPLNPCPIVPCPGVTSTLYEGGRPGRYPLPSLREQGIWGACTHDLAAVCSLRAGDIKPSKAELCTVFASLNHTLLLANGRGLSVQT